MTPTNAERQAEAIESILVSARELFAERGFARVTMDEVAKRSRSSKRTLYRHFSGKVPLLSAVLHRDVNLVMHFEDTGSTVEDIRRLVTEMLAMAARIQSVLSDAIAELPHSEEVAETVLLGRLHWEGRVRGVFERAVERGDLSDDADIELAIFLLAAAVTHIGQIRPELPQELPDRLTQLLLNALGAGAPSEGARIAAGGSRKRK